jgi:hypothetical protein
MNSSTPIASAVATKASKWAFKRPELADRIDRAGALVANVNKTAHPDVYVVEGSHGHKYLVRVHRDAKTSECTCPDSGKGNHCKHRIAVALLEVA